MARTSHQEAERHRGVTLVELLVSVGVIGVLASLLIPSVLAAREAARRSLCKNNLKQIGLALHGRESAKGAFPPSFRTTAVENSQGAGASWSIHGRLMPYLEQANAADRVQLDVDWHEQVHTGVTYLRVPTYLCPSEPNQQIRTKNGGPYVSPHNYGFNLGGWMVYDPVFDRGGDGAFAVNRDTRAAEITNGLSNVLAVAEVKSYQPYLRNTPDPGSAAPDTADYFFNAAGQFKSTGHTVWPDGRVHHSGVTTVFAPNTLVRWGAGEEGLDIDFTSQQEGKSDRRITYAAITSRSHHPGGVNAALMDGSVRTFADRIDRAIWRALGSRG